MRNYVNFPEIFIPVTANPSAWIPSIHWLRGSAADIAAEYTEIADGNTIVGSYGFDGIVAGFKARRKRKKCWILEILTER